MARSAAKEDAPENEATDFVCHHCGRALNIGRVLQPAQEGYLYLRWHVRRDLNDKQKDGVALHDPAMRDAPAEPGWLRGILRWLLARPFPSVVLWLDRKRHPKAMHCLRCANRHHGRGARKHYPLVASPPVRDAEAGA